MRAITHMRDEYKQRVRLMRAREELDRMEGDENEVERGINVLNELDRN